MINGQRGQQLEQELSNWAATDQQTGWLNREEDV